MDMKIIIIFGENSNKSDLGNYRYGSIKGNLIRNL